VEIFARWVHDGVIERVGHRDVAVRIWEHDSAFAGYGAAT